MLFNSWNFLLLFLPLTLWIALRLKGQWLLGWVSLTSYVFYALFGQPWFLIPMLVTTVLDFYLAPWIANSATPKRRKFFLILSLCGNLGLLAYFKYSGFFLESGVTLAQRLGLIHAQPSWLWLFSVALPPGISFYTFQTLSYVIDVYRGTAQPERNFVKFASFVSFFPHLVAGPLTRHHQLLPALENIAQKKIDPRWAAGVFLFSIGLIKKTLVADRIAVIIDPLLASPSLSTEAAWACLLGYSLQIYFDFSGYSDMAIGLGRLFGIELPQNFNSPYKAVNPSDFWKRWHMTLSQWLRDYLYIPLGGSQFSKGRQFASLFITMFLGGLWHGAQWTFALWGIYHGLLLILYHAGKSAWDHLPSFIRRAGTFMAISLGWIFFRADNTALAWQWWATLIQRSESARSFSVPDKLWLYIVGGLFIVQMLPNASSYQKFERLNPWAQVALGVATVTALLFMNYSSNFLYFQF